MESKEGIKSQGINWRTAVFIVSYHLILLIGLPLYFIFKGFSLWLVLIGFALYFATGIAITAGYHRLWAHKAYKANTLVEICFAFLGTLAFQGSVIYWAHKHRLHHAFTDKEGDPHNINRGFWYAHIFWLFERQIPIERKIVEDLYAKKVLALQHEHYNKLATAFNVSLCLFFGWLFDDYIGAFLLIGLARICLLHHSTWFINSLAHTWGSRTYSREITAVNNAVIALLTFGEGYHNYHHVFPSDYRNGVRWFQYDPTKWLIWSLGAVGLAKDKKKINQFTIMRSMVIEDRKILFEAVRESTLAKKGEWEQKINALAESVLVKMNELKESQQEYLALKERGIKKEIKAYKAAFKERKKEFRRQWKEWLVLIKEVTHSPHVPALDHHHATSG